MIKQAFFLTKWDEEEIEEILVRFPKLGDRLRDYVVLVSFNDLIVVHIIIQDMVKDARLIERIEYLGRDYREIAQRAKAGDIPCGKALKRIISTVWEIENPAYPEEGLETIPYRGSLGEWLTAGRPARLTEWFPAHVWLGNHVETPSDEDMQ